MAKTLRKRKIAKAYGLNIRTKRMKRSRDMMYILTRKKGNFILGLEYVLTGHRYSSVENDIKFYSVVDKLRPKTFKSRIGGNY